MSVVAVTPIQHGKEDGEVVKYAVGDELEGDFDDEQLIAFIVNGSAVEIGSERKYTEPLTPAEDPGAVDTATRKRDALIASSLSGEPTPLDQTAATGAVSTGASNADDPGKTIGQTAADAAKGDGPDSEGQGS